MKGKHLRRTPLRSRHEFLIFLFGLFLFGIGIGLMAADAKPDGRTSSPPTTSTTALINSSVIEPEITTTTEPTTTTLLRPVGRVPAPVLKKAVTVAPSLSTTTTTEAPKTPLEVALKYLGQTGPWAEGGFYCARAVSYFAEEAHVEGFVSRVGPSALYADALRDGRLTQTPSVGDMIFIDLFGPEIGHGQVTHVGIVEKITGDEILIVQGNGAPDPSVITETTYRLGDGHVLAFAPFTKTTV
jgi:hypothetical protein